MRMRFASFLVLPLLLIALEEPASGKELVVSAAASLTDAFTDIEPAFEAAHPGVDVIMNFASSGALYRQIEQGAPADVFASANPKWIQRAVENGFVQEEAVQTFAQNALVLAVPAENPAKIKTIADLSDARVQHIGIGTPATVPAGQYAKTALTEKGLYDLLEAKFIFCEHVRQVLDYLTRGEVDAGFVYRTDLVKAKEALSLVEELPIPTPVSYPIAPLAESAQPALASAFVEFVLSPTGQALLEARGFSPGTNPE